jgi:hypothetical protein
VRLPATALGLAAAAALLLLGPGGEGLASAGEEADDGEPLAAAPQERLDADSTDDDVPPPPPDPDPANGGDDTLETAAGTNERDDQSMYSADTTSDRTDAGEATSGDDGIVGGDDGSVSSEEGDAPAETRPAPSGAGADATDRDASADDAAPEPPPDADAPSNDTFVPDVPPVTYEEGTPSAGDRAAMGAPLIEVLEAAAAAAAPPLTGMGTPDGMLESALSQEAGDDDGGAGLDTGVVAFSSGFLGTGAWRPRIVFRAAGPPPEPLPAGRASGMFSGFLGGLQP